MEGARLIDWANRTNEENRAKAAADSPYDPAWTTLHVGIIHGGTAHNITAKDCTFILSARCIPRGTGGALAGSDARGDPARRGGHEGRAARNRHHI